MRIVVAGGSGLLGRPLTDTLVSAGHEVVILTRGRARTAPNGAREVAWTPDGSVGPWAVEIDRADAVVNLSGAGIADKRWSDARKKELRSSRVESTTSLAAAVRASTHPPAVFVQGSAVGYYGSSLDDRVCDERCPPGHDFLSDLAVEWENAAQPVASACCRLAIIRTGIVLTNDGGALPPMARPFRFFVGGRVGTGRQYLSWISREDWVSLVVWTINTAAASGPINATAPTPVTNAQFSDALGRSLERPNWMPVPSVAMRALFGELGTTALLSGQRVVPARALALGFTFEHPSIDRALDHALRG